MSLYLKYRPQTFDDVLGNASSLKALSKMLSQENHPHVYLFTGDTGCGKTTIARILASTIQGNIIEVNSSNNRGIDSAREIIENIQYASMDGKPIVYILDEVHKSTNDFMNAMLKTLEDTPKHVYFCLCTTNPEKLIPAIKSRCTVIELPPLNDDDMLTLLRKVSRNEGVKLVLSIYERIVELADRSPRKALVLLEKILYLNTEEEMLELLGSDESSSATIDLCRGLINEDFEWSDISKIISSLETTDWESIRYAVLGYMASVMLKRPAKRVANAIANFSEPFYNTNKAGLVLACWKTIGR
jgi:DNA polymerase-3 subunit gamma/tau